MSSAVSDPAGLEIATPECEKGLGQVILAPDSKDLIPGVRIHPYALWPDDRGYFLVVLRVGQGLAGEFPTESTQASAALSYPGTIKAFQFHRHQTDCRVPVHGMFQVALVDLRKQSPSFGARNTLYVGTLRPWQLLIATGVAHSYKVIGAEPALLVYVTDRFYNPKDEGRIPYNDPQIKDDWETQHK